MVFCLYLKLAFMMHKFSGTISFSLSFSKSHFPTTQVNVFTYIMSEEFVPSFPSYSCSEYFQKYR